ncbi:hypothetical protein [Streptomyces sp. NPDC050548]|uniref:hypothetical protein n=1 Tax=Streptomyces sp. NPDC050548 TaxID=3365629 RepID=UPI0037A7504E
MALPYARSIAEEHLYMRLHPCVCGSVARTGMRHSTGVIAQGLTSDHEFVCMGCGAERRFVFRLPGLVPRYDDMYGGPDPSQIIDAAEWRMVALDAMGRAQQLRGRRTGLRKLFGRGVQKPQMQRALEEALGSYQEMLKFIPPAADTIPDSAFFTENGRRIRTQEPYVAFERSFIEAMIDGVRSDLADGR